MSNVLVLDAEQRAALAVTRSLVRRDLGVQVASADAAPISGAARGVIGTLSCPAHNVTASQFVTWMSEHSSCCVISVTDATTMLVRPRARHGDEGYEALSDKSVLLTSALSHRVPVPEGPVAISLEGAAAAARLLGWPVVLKPARSKLLKGDRIIATSVRIVRDQDELTRSLESSEWFPTIPVIVQQFIPGHGAGVFCLYDRDHAIAWFAHRRIREKPPSGGVSVLCESVSVVPVLKDYAERLLRAAEYRGVAMVEFRIGTDGRPYLMEVNARFWGSLQLAIDCGVDFPWLYYQMLMGEAVAPMQDYEVGRRLRWWLGDLDHVLLQIRNPALGIGAKLAVVGRFLGTSFDPHCRNEVFRRSDPGPGLLELRQWVAGVLGRAP